MRTGIILGLILVAVSGLGAQTVDAAVQLYNHGRYREAAEILSNLSRQSPADDGLAFQLGKTYLKLHNWDNAIRWLEKAVELKPESSEYHLWLGRAYGQKASHASFFSAFGLARKTRKEFETAVQLAPGSLDARFDLLQFYAEAPGIVGGGKDKAQEQAKEIAKLDPRRGYAARAAIYEEENEWNQARREFVQATMEFPRDAGVWVDLAEFLVDHEDYAGAESSARKALEVDGALPAARMYLAAALAEQHKDVSDAVKTLRELSEGTLTDHDPGFGDVFYWLGEAYLASGQDAAARQALETSLRFDPDYRAAKEALSRIRQQP